MLSGCHQLVLTASQVLTLPPETWRPRAGVPCCPPAPLITNLTHSAMPSLSSTCTTTSSSHTTGSGGVAGGRKKLLCLPFCNMSGCASSASSGYALWRAARISPPIARTPSAMCTQLPSAPAVLRVRTGLNGPPACHLASPETRVLWQAAWQTNSEGNFWGCSQ
jgi:hypothetical protein